MYPRSSSKPREYRKSRNSPTAIASVVACRRLGGRTAEADTGNTAALAGSCYGFKSLLNHVGAFAVRPRGGGGGLVLNVHPFKLPQRLKGLHPDIFVIKALQYAQTQSRMWRWHLILGSSPAPLGARERDAAADGRAAHLAATECSPSAAGIARGGVFAFFLPDCSQQKLSVLVCHPGRAAHPCLQPSAMSLTVRFLQCRP